MSAPFSACISTASGMALMLVGHILLAALLAELMLARGLKVPRAGMACIALAFAALFADVATMASGYLALYDKGGAMQGFTAWSLAWPVGVHVTLACAVAVFVLVAAWHLRKWRMAHITPGAVKEALDRLPRGLCFADAEGVPYLVNMQMERLSLALAGKGLADAGAFWDCVRHLEDGSPDAYGPLSGSSQASESDAEAFPAAVSAPGTAAPQGGSAQEAMLLLGGSAWLFARRPMGLDDGSQCWQITADDVTVEYELSRELARRNERLRQMGERLRAFSRDVQEAIREQEIVRAKAMVHDETGRVLLATAHYLEHPDAGDARAVLDQWQAMADLLLRGADAAESEGDDAQAALDEVVRAAADIGVAVRIQGVPPASGPANGLALRALGEAVVNARKHAGATCVTMRVLPGETPGFLHLEFTNDGTPPQGPIRETGGLATLRQQVQHAAGAMHVEHAPAFKLTLEVPR